jgi:molybdate/tungstate transport system ATP-binding protein
MLELKNISLSYSGFKLSDISFSVDEGEYFILLGKSGAGKSMILEMIAGLTIPDSGQIFLNGRSIEKIKPQFRKVGLVFQDHAIFPHMNVRENIGYALKNKKLTLSEKSSRVKVIAESMHIGDLLERKPSLLSGGELQRVALARTMVQKPQVLLLDEPLASIDSTLKINLRSLLRQINRQGQTIVHVTHDFDEAISLANHIAVIDNGCIIQTGTPEEVFGSPRSEFIANFVGIRNFFKVNIHPGNSGCTVVLGPDLTVVSTENISTTTGYMLLRSEDITLSQENYQSSALNNFKGIVVEIAPSRTGADVTIDIGVHLHAAISNQSLQNLSITESKEIWTHFKAAAVKILPAD